MTAAEKKAAAEKAAAEKAAADALTKTHTTAEFEALKAKLDEFRTNNIALTKEQETLAEKYKDVDLEKYAKITKAEEDANAEKMIKAGQVDELVASKVKDIQSKNAAESVKAAEVNAKLTGQLELLIVDNAVRAASVLEGVIETGIDDMVMRSKAVFKAIDGKAVAHDGAGLAILKTGTVEPITVQDWVKEQASTAPHLFKASTGAGAKPALGIPLTSEEAANMTPASKIESAIEAQKTGSV